jgi:effector-binding domain-containing protein
VSEAVTIKTLPALVAAAYRSSTTQETVFADIPTGFGRVLDALGAAEVDPIGPPFTVFYEAPDADSSGDIAMCVPVQRSSRANPDVELLHFDEQVVAAILHRGPYEDMAESYTSISAWIHQYGHRIVGPTREVYLNSPEDVNAADLLTEIQFPIDPDDGDR